MSVSRRQLLAASTSALWLSACGGGGGGGGDSGGGNGQAITWAVASRGRDGYPLSHVTYSNSTLVANGSDGIGSNNGVFGAISYRNASGAWAAVHIDAIGEFSYLNSLTCGNGRFVAVSSRGEIVTSTDGKTWTLAFAAGDYVEFWHVAFGNGKFLVMGQKESVCSTWSSTDGLAWSAAAPTGVPFGSTLTRLQFVNGKVYLIGGGAIGVSENSGLTWSVMPITVNGVSIVLQGLAYGNGLYVVATDGGMIATSPDFVTWTVRATVTMTSEFLCSEFLNGTFVLLMDRLVLTSADGITWTQTTIGVPGDRLQSVAFDGTKYIAVGNPGLTVTGTLS